MKMMAMNVIQVPTKGKPQEVVSFWYRSEGNADLVTWINGAKQVIKQQLMFHGQLTEWNCVEGIKTGLVVESGKEGNVTQAVRFDSSPNFEAVKMALNILEKESLEEILRKQMISNFKKSAKSSLQLKAALGQPIHRLFDFLGKIRKSIIK